MYTYIYIYVCMYAGYPARFQPPARKAPVARSIAKQWRIFSLISPTCCRHSLCLKKTGLYFERPEWFYRRALISTIANINILNIAKR